MKRDVLHECLACRRFFIKPVAKGRRAPFCADCVSDSLRWVVLAALSVGIGVAVLTFVARVSA